MPDEDTGPKEQCNTKKNPNVDNKTAAETKATQRDKKLEEILPYLLAGESDD